MKLVSIIMNCKNGSKFLESAISSIINQYYKNWEIIFLDNQSIDNSKNIVDLFNEPRIIYHYMEGKNPLSKNWKPLSSNPVIVSDIFGRNAGLIQESSKKIYRISQAYLPGNYGAFISVNKILNISEKDYKEKKIKKILPPYKKSMSGIHTLNYVKNFTVFDYSKWVK